MTYVYIFIHIIYILCIYFKTYFIWEGRILGRRNRRRRFLMRSRRGIVEGRRRGDRSLRRACQGGGNIWKCISSRYFDRRKESNFPSFWESMTDRPTDPPTDRHGQTGSEGSYTSNKCAFYHYVVSEIVSKHPCRTDDYQFPFCSSEVWPFYFFLDRYC